MMNSAVDNSFYPKVFWAEAEAYISVNCEIVGIRPYIPFLVKSTISGSNPFIGFDDFVGGQNRYDYNAKYHKCCLNAYFKGESPSVCTSLI